MKLLLKKIFIAIGILIIPLLFYYIDLTRCLQFNFGLMASAPSSNGLCRFYTPIAKVLLWVAYWPFLLADTLTSNTPTPRVLIQALGALVNLGWVYVATQVITKKV